MTRRMPWLAGLAIVAVLIVDSGKVCAQSDRLAAARLQQWVLPELTLKEATLREGIDLVHQKWVRRYPEASFPIILVESGNGQSGESARITLGLKQVSAWTAVCSLAQGAGVLLRQGLDVCVLRPMDPRWFPEPASDMLNLSDRVMDALTLTGRTYDPVGEEKEAVAHILEQRLADCGIRFPPPFQVSWVGNNQLIVTGSSREINLLKGVLLLLDAGCTIQKEGKCPPATAAARGRVAIVRGTGRGP